jgi:hypothetical protein
MPLSKVVMCRQQPLEILSPWLIDVIVEQVHNVSFSVPNY